MRKRSPSPSAPELRVVEKIRPVEVPVLTETKRRLGRGEVAQALRYAYPQVVADLERAYGMMRAAARARDHLDAWALRAQLAGDRGASDMLFQKYLAGPVGTSDKVRVQRLRVS